MSSPEKIALALAIQANEPVLLWGVPGSAKTRTTEAYSRALKRPLVTILGSTKDPQDFAGLPVIDHATNTVKFAPPAWAKNLPSNAILFLDELTCVPRPAQAPMLGMVQERKVGDDLYFPPGVAIVAAANPTDLAAGGFELSAPLANRFLHINWTYDHAEWISGFLTEWPELSIPLLPDNWKTFNVKAKSMIASFINKVPRLLIDIPKEEAKRGRAYPTMRSWSMFSNLLTAALSVNADEMVIQVLANGTVGEGAATEFLTYTKDLDLPDPEMLLSNPDTFVVPKRGDKLYAILGSVVAAVSSNTTVDRFKAGTKILSIAAKSHQAIAAIMIKSFSNLVASNKDLNANNKQAMKEAYAALKDTDVLNIIMAAV